MDPSIRSSPVSAAGQGARAHPTAPIRVCRNNDLADRLEQHIDTGKLPPTFEQCQWLVKRQMSKKEDAL